MPEQPVTRQRRLANERALYRYTRAFERGDIDTIAAILQEASHDANLEAMIYEMHNFYQQKDIQMENQLQEHTISSQQEDHTQKTPIPGRTFLIPRTRSTRWQRPRLMLQTLAAVLVVAALITSSVLLFTSRHPAGRTHTATGSRTAVTAQGMVIALLGDGSIHAYHGVTGESAWNYSTKQSEPVYSGLVVKDQVVYAALGANIYALHENNGSLIWHKTLPFSPAASSPDESQFIVDAGIVYASAQSLQPLPTVYALRASDGKFLWHITSYQTPLLTASSGVAYVAINNGNVSDWQTTLKALRGSDGHELWHYTTPGELLSATVANNVAYAYAFPGAIPPAGDKYDKQLLAFNASSGSLLWHHNVRYGNASRLDYAQNTLLLSTGNQICAHKSSDGTQIWCTPDLASNKLFQGGMAYLVGSDKVYVAYLTGSDRPLSPPEISTVCGQRSTCTTDAQKGHIITIGSSQTDLHVQALDIQHGQTQWHIKVPYSSDFAATPPFLNLVQSQEDTLLVSSSSPLVFGAPASHQASSLATALSANKGSTLWQMNNFAHQPLLQIVATE